MMIIDRQMIKRDACAAGSFCRKIYVCIYNIVGLEGG
jgi:hypothetical protein